MASIQYVCVCEHCGKRCFPNRKLARRARNIIHAKGSRAYQCGQYWHFGRMTISIRKGKT